MRHANLTARFYPSVEFHARIIAFGSPMQAGLPDLDKEVKAKRIEAEMYAGLLDRFRTLIAEPAHYGMHVTPDANGELDMLIAEL